MIKFIAADMDGTLIGNDHKISEKNIEAIKEAQKRNIKFAIASGRIYADIKPFLDSCDLKCECITLNGAEYIDEDGNLIEGIYLDKEKVRKILEVITDGKFSVQIYTDKGYYTTNSEEETFEGMIERTKVLNPKVKDMDELIKITKEDPHYVNTKYISDLDEFLSSDLKISKLISFGECEEEILKLKGEVSKIGGLSVSSSFRTNIEVNDEKATKGSILAKVAEKQGIKRDEVAVFGDGLNDYSMFTEFENTFAMKNADPEIKEVARYMTDANYEDGVGKGIMKILNDEI